MYGEPHSHGKPGEPPVLSMACITQRERHACDQKAVRSAVLEQQVGDWLAGLVLPPDWRARIEVIQRGVVVAADERPAVDVARTERQLSALKDLFALGDLTREEYVVKTRALRASLEVGRPQPVYPTDTLERAARLLDDLADLWRKATPKEREELANTLFTEVRIRDQAIVGATPANPAYLPLIALMTARNDEVGMAPPDGFEPPTPALGRLRSIH